FVLIRTGVVKPVPELPEPDPLYDSYPKWLADGWNERDEWLAGHLERVAPRIFRQLEETMLRAEQRWLGGADPTTVERELKEDLTRLRKFRADPIDHRLPLSLAMAQ